MLVSQNKAGARAMEELEQLRIALAHFREEIARTGQHGIVPEIHAAGPLPEIGASLQIKRRHLLAFFGDLRERVRRVSEELRELGRIAGLERRGGPAAPAPVELPPSETAAAAPDPLEAGLERVTDRWNACASSAPSSRWRRRAPSAAPAAGLESSWSGSNSA